MSPAKKGGLTSPFLLTRPVACVEDRVINLRVMGQVIEMPTSKEDLWCEKSGDGLFCENKRLESSFYLHPVK